MVSGASLIVVTQYTCRKVMKWDQARLQLRILTGKSIQTQLPALVGHTFSSSHLQTSCNWLEGNVPVRLREWVDYPYVKKHSVLVPPRTHLQQHLTELHPDGWLFYRTVIHLTVAVKKVLYRCYGKHL